MNEFQESWKKKIRYEYLKKRDKMEPFIRYTYSDIILTNIKKMKEYKGSKLVMFYLSYGSEVITDKMINEVLLDGKEVAVPVIQNPGDDNMTAVKINKLEDCVEKVYGIRQPEFNESDVVSREEIDLIFVPGIVFDTNGYRIGYGKGYYDRWLQGTDISRRVGIAFEVQLIEKIPNGEYDLPVGRILTENRVIEVIKN